MKIGPRKAILYGRHCKYFEACALKPHDILNAKKASGKTIYCLTEYAIYGLVFFFFRFLLETSDWCYSQIQYYCYY